MAKVKCLAIICLAVLIVGCGPDTIFVRPGLDTPAQHVENGHQLLQRGKVDDACREFKRAKELDPNFVRAYIGLGVALGRKGEFAAGLASMDQASQMASTPQEIAEVRKGYEQLNQIKRKSISP
jgi:lipopolysaccharide biosynthesis regulator YciM